MSSDLAWDQFEITLRMWYLEQDLSLEEVRNRMTAIHQFTASKAQYEHQFKKWNFRKNCTAAEWKVVAEKVTARQIDNKDSEVFWNLKRIEPKKLKKETMRYGSISRRTPSSTPLPPTPKGFIIRTPSPEPAVFMSTFSPAQLFPISPHANLGSTPVGNLPFYQFSSILSQEGNLFSGIPENGGSAIISLPQDIQSTVLDELKQKNGSFSQKIEALMPNGIFYSNETTDTTMSRGEASPAKDFLKLTLFLASNNFFGATSEVSRKVYNWLRCRSNAGLMEYLLSLGGPTVESLTEQIFRLAMDAEDARTVEKMIKLGINPNEQVYRDHLGLCRTPLIQACQMQSLELVKVLIDGGAKVNEMEEGRDTDSELVAALDFIGEDGEPMDLVDVELVRVLLQAGAVIDPGGLKSPLNMAAESGHVEAVEILVSAGADVNTTTVDSENAVFTPLGKAMFCEGYIPIENVISVTRILLNAGADPQFGVVMDNEHTSVLESAMWKKNNKLIELLLESGARITESAFTDASRNFDIDTAKLFIKFGGKVTEKVVEDAVINRDPKLVVFLIDTANDKIKQRAQTAALIKAFECGKIDLIRCLEAGGAKLGRNSNLSDAIRNAAGRNDIDLLRLVLDKTSKYRSRVACSLDSALCIAVREGRNDIIDLLLNAGANVNADNKDITATPLLAAIKRKDPHLVLRFLAAGAEVNGRASYLAGSPSIATSVLPAVVRWGHQQLLSSIIKAGADVDAPENYSNESALYIAAQKGDLSTMQLLIEAGADINNPVGVVSGNTALEAASRNNNTQMVQHLLDLGAEPDEGSLLVAVSGTTEIVEKILAARLSRYKRYSKGYGSRALQYAVKSRNSAMIEILLANGIDTNTIIRPKVGDKTWFLPEFKQSLEPVLDYGKSPLGSAIVTDNTSDLKIVQRLLRGGADPNGIVTDGDETRTALLEAIKTRNLVLVKTLIDAGAGLNPSNISRVKRTPLQQAAEEGAMEIIKLLLEHGAEVNAPPHDDHGATALQFAAIGGYVGIAHFLIDRGADVNSSPAKRGGRTALEAAAEHGRIDMLQLLLISGAMIIGPGLEQYERAREFASEQGHMAARRLLEKCNDELCKVSETLDPMSTAFSGLFEDFQL